jgi:DNA-binding IclR family transcriptional regulator
VAERLSGLRDSVPVGAALTMQAGSAAQILLAWEDSEKIHRGLTNARFTAAQLPQCLHRCVRLMAKLSPP